MGRTRDGHGTDIMGQETTIAVRSNFGPRTSMEAGGEIRKMGGTLKVQSKVGKIIWEAGVSGFVGMWKVMDRILEYSGIAFVEKSLRHTWYSMLFIANSSCNYLIIKIKI